MKRNKFLFFISLFSFLLISCTPDKQIPTTKGTRDNTPIVLTPQADGIETIGNERITYDLSHVSQGYLMVQYTGDNPKVKVRIKNPNDKDPYTYDLEEGYNVLPITGGNGTYVLSAYENITGTRYSKFFQQDYTIELENDYIPYLYPNQYVNFDEDSKTVAMGQELAVSANNDLDVVSLVYDYVIDQISYDDQRASQIEKGQLTGYIPDVDSVLAEKKGICFDYAAVMATMLRSQNIPTRMMIGYAKMPDGSVYHAWIGVYIKDIGWVDDLIEFDGQNWSMMDPTLVAENNNNKTVRDFITNTNNYLVKYLY